MQGINYRIESCGKAKTCGTCRLLSWRSCERVNNFKRKDWGVEKIGGGGGGGGEGEESFNMAPEIEFSQKFNFPPSHKTTSYSG